LDDFEATKPKLSKAKAIKSQGYNFSANFLIALLIDDAASS